MPTKAVPRITAWSFSRLSDYEKCPLMAKYKHVDKMKEPGSPAMDRGSAIDKIAEDYSIGRIAVLPAELRLFKDEFAVLRKLKRILQPQQNLALTRAWTPTDWFGPQAWLRIKMDVFYDDLKKAVRRIIDYKTGKIREEHKDQLELYAVGGLAYAPVVIERFDTELWYLDQGELTPQSFTRDQAEGLKVKWEKRTRKMLADVSFKPTPGKACDFCWFGQRGKAKGGPGLCKY